MEKFDCFQILVSAVDIRHPFSFVLSIIKIEHGSHRIHTDTVHVEFTHPVIGTGLQETSCFAAGMHKVAASPFADTDSRVRILIKRSSVIICQTVSVHSEMNRNKVHQHADAVFVAGIHESL